MMNLARDAGFQQVTRVDSDGKPGVFATLDAGAPRTLGLYFMYDVKQVDPAEWASPPWEAAHRQAGLGKVLMARGAVNQKGPQASMLAALHAIRGAGRKIPVNLVLVAEGEEEIGSPNFPQIVRKPEVQAALSKCSGIFMPSAAQGADGVVTVSLGAKGVIECELVSSGENWGRGPRKDIHSSNKARLDSPAWHLVQALNTLVSADGNEPAIEGFADKALPISAEHKKMIAEAAKRMDEARAKKVDGRRALGERCRLARGVGTARLQADGEYRRTGRRIHRPRRQDDPAAQSGREAGSAAGSEHDGGGGRRSLEDTSRQARLRRYRGEDYWRLRSEQHAG